MDNTENINTLQSTLADIWERQNLTAFQKNKLLFENFELILEEATTSDRLNFTTLFSRLAYVGTRFQLSGQTVHLSHVFRKAHERGTIRTENESAFVQLGFYICFKLIEAIYHIKAPTYIKELENDVIKNFKKSGEKIIGFRAVVEAVLFEIDTENKHMLFFDDADPDKQKTAKYDVYDKNEIFNGNVESLCKTFSLPLHINFIDVEISEDGTYIPSGWIIQPDHLVDVTAITECFKDFGTEPFLYLIAKFKPSETSSALLTGNLVNLLLDELITNKDLDFNSILPALFRAQPMGWALLDDGEVLDVIKKLKDHFVNLSFAVRQEFSRFGIIRDHIFLEPSFISRDYGIQGRLDLLHQKEGRTEFDIVELKSGKSFKPNVYGINASHYIQTLLYDLMIKSVFQTKAKSVNYILYSRENDKPMRFAPPVKPKQYEAMKLRNDLIAIEQKLQGADKDPALLQYIKPDNFPKLKGFNFKDVENFHNIYSTLNELEKLFFNHFTAFIAREQAMAKYGTHGLNRSNGHAALWLESDEEKRERFGLLSSLSIISNSSDNDDSFIIFKRDTGDFTLVNFRVGDIAVLYPVRDEQFRPVLKNHIFKCTITSLSNELVGVKLRNRQYNQSLFKENISWNLEADSLDSGFNQMYKNLFIWAAAPFEYRKMYMGLTKPRYDADIQNNKSDQNEMTSHQSALLKKMISSKDYFLLWGPPGTGKTSVMLKNMVKHLFENTKENMLLLAYTNKAVDEICEAVMSIDESYQHHFLRIGSRLATHEKFSNTLMDHQIRSLKSRQEILSLIKEKRIFISTVSSIIGKTEIFFLKEFDTVIIDEASQILEPMLCGLLSKFKRWIMIGDHKQLPAVVTQDHFESKINHENLKLSGFTDTRISLFERLFMQINQMKWDHAYGILHQQGRMHQDLMEFPNNHYYEKKLTLLPNSDRLLFPAFFKCAPSDTAYLLNRKIFFDTPEDEEMNWKTNIHEANKVANIIQELISLYEYNGMPFRPDSIGVITPYRAQIALIRKCLEIVPMKYFDVITVDTVERYQGGARDIIIISFCVNRLNQLDSLVSLSQEGVDRKLNVALTRAKEQIILVGNKQLLVKNQGYKDLISHYSID